MSVKGFYKKDGKTRPITRKSVTTGTLANRTAHLGVPRRLNKNMKYEAYSTMTGDKIASCGTYAGLLKKINKSKNTDYVEITQNGSLIREFNPNIPSEYLTSVTTKMVGEFNTIEVYDKGKIIGSVREIEKGQFMLANNNGIDGVQIKNSQKEAIESLVKWHRATEQLNRNT